jgi:hypothetical protein
VSKIYYHVHFIHIPCTDCFYVDKVCYTKHESCESYTSSVSCDHNPNSMNNIYIYMCVCVCVCMYVCISMFIWICGPVHVFVCVYLFLMTCVCVEIYLSAINSCMYMYMCSYRPVYLFMYRKVWLYTHIDINILVSANLCIFFANLCVCDCLGCFSDGTSCYTKKASCGEYNSTVCEKAPNGGGMKKDFFVIVWTSSVISLFLYIYIYFFFFFFLGKGVWWWVRHATQNLNDAICMEVQTRVMRTTIVFTLMGAMRRKAHVKIMKAELHVWPLPMKMVLN